MEGARGSAFKRVQRNSKYWLRDAFVGSPAKRDVGKLNYHDDRPATRGDLNFLEERIGYRLKILGAVIVYGLLMLLMVLKW
jgi:hypothetical protein